MASKRTHGRGEKPISNPTVGDVVKNHAFLAHYGVTGMRWGKHKSRYDKSVKIYGGSSPHKNLSAKPKSIDAMKAHNYKDRAKSAGTDALSTKELKNLVERMNLEQQYSRLNPAPVSAGQKLLGTLLPAIGSAVAGQYASRQPQSPAATPSKEISLYTKPSTKKLVADIAFAAGKEVLKDQGMNIGMAIVKSMLK